MAQSTVTIDAATATAMLATVIKQLPFAASTMINDLGFQVQRAENAAMSTVFKHPRPFTAKSVQVDRSTKSTLSATVFVRPEVAKYLQPYETGGVHVLPGRALLDPKGIALDQYGQLPMGTMARLRGRPDIYIGPVTTRKGGIVTGVWQRVQVTRTGKAKVGKNAARANATARLHDAVQGQLKLLIRFGDALPVKEHLDFNTRGVALVMANAAAAFGKALQQALTSMR